MSTEVIHDEHGIPHIWGDTVAELAFAQGSEMAGARAAQIELERLRSEGTVAAHLGEPGLEWDRFSRRARIDATAQRAYDALDAETQEFLVAFTDGINTAFRDRRWMPWTPLGVFWVQQIQFGSYGNKLWRHRLRTELGEAALPVLETGPPPVAGSNAYALTGEHTASGHPIIAGDPHRVFESPNIYLQTHLACPEFDVAGFCFPGVPGIQHFGHTGSVAWGLTNAMADYQDLYLEKLERRGRGVLALGPDGWEEATVLEEEIELLDDELPETLEVVVTARGPVILGGPDDAEAISLRTASHQLGDLGFGALLPLLRARTTLDVEAALERWVEPVNNWVVADAGGTVRHRVAGRVPERDRSNFEGPVPAEDPRHRWTGWVADLPVTEPGALGRVVTANERASAAYDKISGGFAPSWRADRIHELLAGRHDWAPEEAVDVLLDVRQLGGDTLLDAVAALTGLDDKAAVLQQELAAWDREMTADSRGATLFTAVREELTTRICADPAFADLQDPTTYGDLHAPWLHLPARVGHALPRLVARGETIGLDVPAMLRSAVEAVAAAEPAGWGERHGFAPLSGPAQFGLADRPVPVAGRPLDGDADCVAATGWLPGTSHAVRGPVARYVWDLADRSRSRWAVPLGAAGDPASRHHTDQFDAWRTGALLAVGADPSPLQARRDTAPVPSLDDITLAPVDPITDIGLIHEWVSQERAEFWGMRGKSVDEVAEIYGYIDGQRHLAAFLASWHGRPWALFQTYDPFVDPIGEFYDRREGDIGAHLLLAPGPRPAGLTAALLEFLPRWLFRNPQHRRVVLEPDVRNAKSLAALDRIGAEPGPVRDLPGKTAQFAFVTRERWESGGESPGEVGD